MTFLGTSASVPSAGRGLAATLVARGGSRILIDCGEGTQRQLLRSGIGLVDMDLILITHLHADHFLGLPGILKTYALRGRDRPLRLVGPFGLKGLLDRLGSLVGRLPYRLDVEEWSPGDGMDIEGGRISSFVTEHRIASLGFVLAEHDRPGSFDVAAARAAGVPEGPDWGRLQRGEVVTTPAGVDVDPTSVMGEARSGRRLVFSGDTLPCGTTIDAAKGATLLVHEATFLDEDADRARETSHSTARQAALVARTAEVTLLALTHISTRARPRDLRGEAEATFDRVIVPRDFDAVEIPFPERGVPEHIRFSADRPDTVPPDGQVADL